MEFYFKAVRSDVTVISLDGGLERFNSGELVRQSEALIDGGVHRIVFDCERLNSISSYGMGALLRLHKRCAQRGGDVKIANLRGVVADAMHLTGLARVFDIFPTVDEALHAFPSPSGGAPEPSTVG